MAMARSIGSQNWNIALAALALLWAGTVIGVSGLATPAKFAAPSLTLPVALDVGRVTFHLLAHVEWGLAGLLIVCASFARISRRAWLPIVAVVGIVAVQSAWMLPELDIHVAATMRGTPLPPTPLHGAYIAAEFAKLCILLIMGLGTARRLAKTT